MMNIALVNGTRLGYWESGRGPKSLLLVHGWGCDHTTLVPLMEHFRHSYRVIAGDLTGHGISDKPHQEYTVVGFAGDLARLCRELRFKTLSSSATAWVERPRSILAHAIAIWFQPSF